MEKINKRIEKLKRFDYQIQKECIKLRKLKVKRAELIFKLRLQGETYQSIGNKLGISRQAIFNVINPKYKNYHKKSANKN